jgi:hypothetical protein
VARKLSFAAPFLVAIFTVISLYAGNADRLEPGQMVAPMVFALAIAGLFLLLFWLFRPTSDAATFVAALFSFVFLVWHLLNWYELSVLMAGALFFGVVSKKRLLNGTLLLCLILALSLSYSSVVAGITAAGRADTVAAGGYTYTLGQPNIYFIVPDRMPSFAAMRESGIDPEQALADLRALGFYVNENQLSQDPYTVDYTGEVHTTRTMRFFASVLNGGQAIPMEIGYQDCRALIVGNSAFTQLHAAGYRIKNVASWFAETSRFTEADENLTYENVGFLENLFRDELSGAYFERTILAGLNFRVWEPDASKVRVETGRVFWQRDQVLKVAESGETSTFTFAHLLFPHEPYIYADPADSIPAQYEANIRAALAFLTDLVGTIRAADPSAVIIIQSDEGMAYRKPIELNNDLSPVQWNGVFTAWYLPDYTGNKDKIKHTDILAVVVKHEDCSVSFLRNVLSIPLL